MKSRNEYCVPYNRMGSFLHLLDPEEKIHVFMGQGGDVFQGTVGEFLEYAKTWHKEIRGSLLDYIVGNLSNEEGVTKITIKEPAAYNGSPRNRLDEIGELTMLPPQLIQLMKVRDLLLIIDLDTPIQLVTETRQGSYWETLYRGVLKGCLRDVGTFKGYLDSTIRDVLVLDGYLSIHVKDKTLT